MNGKFLCQGDFESTSGHIDLDQFWNQTFTKEAWSSLADILFKGLTDFVSFHKGFIPDTFAGLEKSKIAFAHIDVDIYQSVSDCCQFLYPLLVPGGVLIFDDYGLPTCPGARLAVDCFFTAKAETPIVLPTGQAIVIKLPSVVP